MGKSSRLKVSEFHCGKRGKMKPAEATCPGVQGGSVTVDFQGEGERKGTADRVEIGLNTPSRTCRPKKKRGLVSGRGKEGEDVR